MESDRNDLGDSAPSANMHNAEIESQSWQIDPTPLGLLDAPLDFLFAEHHRQRQAAQVLLLVADGEINPRGIDELITFLEHDFALHVADEELAFFPILKRCCTPEDEIEPLLKRLTDEHKGDETISDEALIILKKRRTGEALTVNDCRRLHVFAEHIRQHLAVENAVLLPIARVRMEADSLKAFSERLKARRGL